MGLESQACGLGFCSAGIVCVGFVGREHELVTDGEVTVGDGAGLADGVTGWVAVPFSVGDADVAQVVELVGGIVGVDICGYVVGCAGEFVGAVFNSPQPVRVRDAGLEQDTNMLLPSKVKPTSLRRPHPA